MIDYHRKNFPEVIMNMIFQKIHPKVTKRNLNESREGVICEGAFGKAEANTKTKNYWNVPLRDSLLICCHVLPAVNFCLH